MGKLTRPVSQSTFAQDRLNICKIAAAAGSVDENNDNMDVGQQAGSKQDKRLQFEMQ